MRLNELHEAIPDISQKMLTMTLPPLISNLINWAIENFDDVISDRRSA
ncbi:MAG: winged helix-turn-helix transcriptional regulator [Bacteroidales bacterium]